eukprot:TRINITY_DN2650_c0_g1_i1.p1 TRINITY_DN2650_c0_g1~~TRINITY_DN2650_c0_g1_i1.p1  ORF type:complete len:474 (+),score=194.63 TRINITY_DN2650_c0_g1_i1:320-1741(+)
MWALPLVVALHSASYVVDKHVGCSQIYFAVSDPNNSTEWVRYLGSFSTTDQCIQACIANGTADSQCQSYTYNTPEVGGDFAQHCYGRFGEKYGSVWFPVPQENVNCGRILYPCKSDANCQFNGECNTATGQCSCEVGWGGPRCQELQLLPAVKGAGYNKSAEHISSWGGTVLMDKKNTNNDTKYHMYIAEMEEHCGLNSWVVNSVLTHAQSTKGADGPYEKKAVLSGAFSHEPNAMMGPNGEFAMFYSYYNYSVPLCQCEDGSTPPGCDGPVLQVRQEVLAYSETPEGPFKTCVVWEDRAKNPPLTPTDDTNLAGVVLSNGSFIGMMRHWDDGFGSVMHLVTAQDWKNCSGYTIQQALLFPQLPLAGAEDPFVYLDCKGRFHAIFHNKSPGNADAVVGAHAYSENGLDWIFAGSIYDNVVHNADGTTDVFSRRERPHFIFADDECTPVALTTGVVYGGKYGDASYTHLQPVKH